MLTYNIYCNNKIFPINMQYIFPRVRQRIDEGRVALVVYWELHTGTSASQPPQVPTP